MYHVGTGWYCWEKLQQELKNDQEREELPLLQFPRGKPTPAKKRKELRLAFAKLYESYRQDGDPAAALRFVSVQIRAARMDVLMDVLIYLSDQKDKKRTPLLRQIVASASWQGLVRSLKPLDARA